MTQNDITLEWWEEASQIHFIPMEDISFIFNECVERVQNGKNVVIRGGVEGLNCIIFCSTETENEHVIKIYDETNSCPKGLSIITFYDDSISVDFEFSDSLESEELMKEFMIWFLNEFEILSVQDELGKNYKP